MPSCMDFRRHRCERFRPLVSMLYRSFVCHIRALCSNGWKYRPDFFCIRPMCLPDHIKIWPTSVDPFFTKLCPKSDTPPVDLSVQDIRRQIVAEWLEIAQWPQWRTYRKPPSLVRMVPLLTSTTSFPKYMGPKYTPGPTSRRVLPQDLFCILMSRAMSPFFKLL